MQRTHKVFILPFLLVTTKATPGKVVGINNNKALGMEGKGREGKGRKGSWVFFHMSFFNTGEYGSEQSLGPSRKIPRAFLKSTQMSAVI